MVSVGRSGDADEELTFRHDRRSLKDGKRFDQGCYRYRQAGEGVTGQRLGRASRSVHRSILNAGVLLRWLRLPKSQVACRWRGDWGCAGALNNLIRGMGSSVEDLQGTPRKESTPAAEVPWNCP